ncbi:MAG: tRNA-dihydrouridine synthase family protein [Planctomycetes bacterium]|nr:tRNA-dihydrouridine synthase family protein [Planctomycetota bacterium]
MPLPFTSFRLLAPMEGVTEPQFRDLVLARNAPDALGGTFTEFVRVVDHALPVQVLTRHLGTSRFEQPVGLQLMGADLDALAATARRAAELGVPVIDLNFGCPAKGALRGCAGSAMLREPRKLEDAVRACVATVGDRPVTAKIRAGFDDALLLEDLARAVEAGGAALLTIHCRTRAEAYCEAVDWSRIARAVAAVRIPVCGNGGIETHADFERMRRETGCAYAMVGRGALADPWIFSGRSVDAAEAASFLVEYAERLIAGGGASLAGAVARVKQLLRFWTAGELVGSERREWLRESEPQRLAARLRGIAKGLDATTRAASSTAAAVG